MTQQQGIEHFRKSVWETQKNAQESISEPFSLYIFIRDARFKWYY